MLPGRYADDLVTYSYPVFIKTSTKRMLPENPEIKGKIRDCIRCRYCAEDNVGIAKDRGPWRVTFDLGV
jgi:hypothetical protein